MYIWIFSNKFDLKQTIRVLHTEVELSPHHLLVEGLNPATAKCQWLQVNEIAKIVQGLATCGCGTEVEHLPHYLLVEGLNLATPNGIR